MPRFRHGRNVLDGLTSEATEYFRLVSSWFLEKWYIYDAFKAGRIGDFGLRCHSSRWAFLILAPPLHFFVSCLLGLLGALVV